MGRPVFEALSVACFIVSVINLGPLALNAQNSRPATNSRPPLFFREEWKQNPQANRPRTSSAAPTTVRDIVGLCCQPDDPEHPITQAAVTNPKLDLHVYGDKNNIMLVL